MTPNTDKLPYQQWQKTKRKQHLFTVDTKINQGFYSIVCIRLSVLKHLEQEYTFSSQQLKQIFIIHIGMPRGPERDSGTSLARFKSPAPGLATLKWLKYIT